MEKAQEQAHGAKRKADQMEQEVECVVCQADGVRKEVVFMPCSHMATCGACAEPLTKCPICRAPIKRRLRVNMA